MKSHRRQRKARRRRTPTNPRTRLSSRSDAPVGSTIDRARQPVYGQGIVVSLIGAAFLLILAILAVRERESVTGTPATETTGPLFWGLAVLFTILIGSAPSFPRFPQRDLPRRWAILAASATIRPPGSSQWPACSPRSCWSPPCTAPRCSLPDRCSRFSRSAGLCLRAICSTMPPKRPCAPPRRCTPSSSHVSPFSVSARSI